MNPELTIPQSVVGALVIALLLAALHLGAGMTRTLPLVPERATGSFAGGLAVAYVFLHLLPEIAKGNEALRDVLDDVVERAPLIDLGIFFVALVGFAVFYGLERLAGRSTSRQVDRTTHEATSAAGVYWLHLGSFMTYNALITYTMTLRLRTGIAFAVLFAVAMGLHFVLTDRGLEEHYPDRFNRVARIALASALLVGWAASAVFSPTSELAVSLLTALLCGSILHNVFKEDCPRGNDRASPGSSSGSSPTPRS